jgi:DNA-binding CsgD family transcriptional regulator
VAAYCAEAAWLRNDMATAERILTDALPLAIASGEPSLVGPLLVWLMRCGASVRSAEVEVAPEYRTDLAGDWRGAAAVWERLGCPYERALALLAGDAPAATEALDIFTSLGAQPLVDMARRRLRQLGGRVARRGPYRVARSDPLGLTKREREIFDLVVEGYSNASIAGRLHRSERTIEHHIAGIFDKLGVKSRAELRAYCTASSDT